MPPGAVPQPTAPLRALFTDEQKRSIAEAVKTVPRLEPLRSRVCALRDAVDTALQTGVCTAEALSTLDALSHMGEAEDLAEIVAPNAHPAAIALRRLLRVSQDILSDLSSEGSPFVPDTVMQMWRSYLDDFLSSPAGTADLEVLEVMMQDKAFGPSMLADCQALVQQQQDLAAKVFDGYIAAYTTLGALYDGYSRCLRIASTLPDFASQDDSTQYDTLSLAGDCAAAAYETGLLAEDIREMRGVVSESIRHMHGVCDVRGLISELKIDVSVLLR